MEDDAVCREVVAPQRTEAEEALIGSLLIDGECIARIAPMLQPGDFYRERNQLCYDAAMALSHRNQAIDQTTLAGELARTGKLDLIGGMAYLSHLVSITPTSVHAEDYADIVSRTAAMRKLIAAGVQDRRTRLQRHRRPGHDAAAGRGRALRGQEHHAAARLPVLPGHFRPLPAGAAVVRGRPPNGHGRSDHVGVLGPGRGPGRVPAL